MSLPFHIVSQPAREFAFPHHWDLTVPVEEEEEEEEATAYNKDGLVFLHLGEKTQKRS